MQTKNISPIAQVFLQAFRSLPEKEKTEFLTILKAEKEDSKKDKLAWLSKCDTIAGSIQGDFDSARDVQEIRENRN